MEILLWLVPPAVVTGLAMVWVAWLGREGRGEVSREEAVRRLGAALERQGRRRRRRELPGYAVPPRARERSTGVAVRTAAPRPPAEERRAS